MLHHLTTAAPRLIVINEDGGPPNERAHLWRQFRTEVFCASCGHDLACHSDPMDAQCTGQDCRCVTFKNREDFLNGTWAKWRDRLAPAAGDTAEREDRGLDAGAADTESSSTEPGPAKAKRSKGKRTKGTKAKKAQASLPVSRD